MALLARSWIRPRPRWFAIAPVLALAIPFALRESPVPARGQTVATLTPTPTATVTPTASPLTVPSVKSVLSAARTRLRQAGSARVTLKGTLFQSTSSPPGTAVLKISGRADISSGKHRLHSFSTTTGLRSGAPEREEAIDVGKWTANRLNNGPWSCHHAQVLDRSLYDLAQLIAPLKSPWTITADTVSGVPVWHVHARYVDPASAETGHADYDFTQSDNTLIQGSLTVKATGAGVPAIRLTLSFTMSHLGERVKVKLPAACHAATTATALGPVSASLPTIPGL